MEIFQRKTIFSKSKLKTKLFFKESDILKSKFKLYRSELNIELNISFKIQFAESKENKLHIPGYGLSQKACGMENHNYKTFDFSDSERKRSEIEIKIDR